LAEALRAQAAGTGQSALPPAPPTVGAPAAPAQPVGGPAGSPGFTVPIRWILLLALLLGLAAGATIGLLTML
jgi:hypothetical protein